MVSVNNSMAATRALVVDIWLSSLLGFEWTLRVLGQRDIDELAPFLLHAPHALIALVGILGLGAEGTSWAPRILGCVAPLTAFGDALACVWHANLLRFAHSSSGDAECLVLAALSLALALSALNVWWTSGGGGGDGRRPRRA